MAITRTPIHDDDGSGTTGTIIDNAWKQELYDQIDGVTSPGLTNGLWVDVPFAAANFYTPTAGASWVVTSQAGYAYTIIGKTAIVTVSLFASAANVITGSPIRLRVKLPAALSAPARTNQAAPFLYLNTTWGTGLCGLSGSELDLLRDPNGTAFVAGQPYLYINFPFSLA